jgi:hypothetical protein
MADTSPIPSTSHFRFDPLTGAEETVFGPGGGAAEVLWLVGRLARAPDGARLDMTALGASEADRLSAALYAAIYGDRAECRLRCRGCDEGYEFALALSDLIAAQDADRPGPPDAEGWWRLDAEREVRAPTLADLKACPDPEALAARLTRGPAGDPGPVAEFLERAAPLMSVDLQTACPHCGAEESVRFDLAVYFAARLAGERPFLVRETHLIAGRYGWSHAEIMALPRDERRTYAGLIENERGASLRSARRQA